MTELNSFSININSNKAKRRTELASTFNNTVEYPEQLPKVHYQRLNSKTILQNMEEVLNSVKKQHKEKHKRKKELKKLAMIEAAHGSKFLSAAHGSDLVSVAEGVSKEKRKEQSVKKHRHRVKQQRVQNKNPLQEKSTEENGKVLPESPVKSGTILQHFPRTPKKVEYVTAQVHDVEVITEDKNENVKNNLSPPNNSKFTNAFEVMMNARNKSIGSNTPGKEAPSPLADKEFATGNAKRKLKLQELAEQKGASKHKFEEEARSAYIEEQLNQRAKRFKEMLVSSGSTPKACAKGNIKSKAQKNILNENSDKKKPKKRSLPRTRRLSSDDSDDTLDKLLPSKIDEETAEFLAKLNSPVKKRDSLLGYFHKKQSKRKEANNQTSEEAQQRKDFSKNDTPKRSRKTVGSSNSASVKASNPKIACAEAEKGIRSGRPRRSCAGKARYDYDLEKSPSKAEEFEKNAARTTAKSVINTSTVSDSPEQECVDTIISLDDSTNMSSCSANTPNGTPKKLAPLFVRSLPKPNPDPEIVKARKAFLQSGVPEKLRLEQDRQKQYEQCFEETNEVFPKISHVKQLSDIELEFDNKVIKYSFKLKKEETISLSPLLTRKSKASSIKQQSVAGLLSDCNINNIQLQKNFQNLFSDEISLPAVANKRLIIKTWKSEFEPFPTYKCYNQMREKYHYFSAVDSAQDTEQVNESFVVTRQTRRSLEAQKKKELDNLDEEYKPPATAPNGELLFTEKYKPLLFEQVLVNLNPVAQLKEFLSRWSNNGSGSAKNSQTFEDSSDTNDSTCSNQGSTCNTVVLLGPVSSGKTSAVFALANEMNFNVLEINAGMKRTGKRLIQELQEATQSHQIRKDASGSGSSQKVLLKMSINGLKSKHKKENFSTQIESQNCDSNSSDLQNTTRKCLILIEDADIVFEQTDAGFTDAIYSLVASSKRPVIVVASNPNCAHLQRLIAQNTIYFSSPNVLNISRFLAVLSLIENCPVQLDDLISLYLYNRRDIRKTLLELQFFIQSGGDRQRQWHCEVVPEASARKNGNYFASPRKRQFSVEQEIGEPDNSIPTDNSNANTTSNGKTYMHRSLFEYYTVSQNSKWRIPFPTDFHLLNVNLPEIFKVSRELQENMNKTICENTVEIATKRKSKSPKKQWLTAARENLLKSPLDNMCSFYENLSVAALMDELYNIVYYHKKPNPSIIDRLKPNISETISHCLLEKSIELNLGAELCPYNLIDTPKNSISLCKELCSMQLRSNRARYLDYEPSLRSICRSEKIRSTLERRSTRFYHYFRNYSFDLSNFSTIHFDQACEAFAISDEDENQQTQH